MKGAISKLSWDRRGATAVEYSLIAALVSIAAIGGMSMLGGRLAAIYGMVEALISGVLP
jgi:pilus assembly protein Flp/PilA